jgi:hypothetical protein
MHADAVDKTLAFDPKATGDYRIFWSSGTAWGELVRHGGKLSLTLLGGHADLKTVRVGDHVYAGRTLTAGQSLDLH